MIDEIFADAKERFDKAHEAFQREAAKLRTGRANAGLLEGVRVDYYGQTVPLNQVAAVTVADARLLSVRPWEKQMLAPVEKAIMTADLGLTPSNRGDTILVPIPPLTTERRRDMVRLLKKEAEAARVSVRQARRDAMDMLDALDDISEDDVHRAKKQLQDDVDAAVERIDAFTEGKEKDIMET
jgi:ribosome recycling factor